MSAGPLPVRELRPQCVVSQAGGGRVTVASKALRPYFNKELYVRVGRRNASTISSSICFPSTTWTRAIVKELCLARLPSELSIFGFLDDMREHFLYVMIHST